MFWLMWLVGRFLICCVYIICNCWYWEYWSNWMMFFVLGKLFWLICFLVLWLDGWLLLWVCWFLVRIIRLFIVLMLVLCWSVWMWCCVGRYCLKDGWLLLLIGLEILLVVFVMLSVLLVKRWFLFWLSVLSWSFMVCWRCRLRKVFWWWWFIFG